MKILCKFLLICGLCVSMSTVRAQWVPAGNNLAYAVYLVDTGCANLGVNGMGPSSIDTSCAAVLSMRSLGINGDPTCLQYFKGLDSLVLYSYDTIQAFPPSLRYLSLSTFNTNPIMAPLPDSLRTLIFDNGSYVHTVPLLPPYLEHLECIGPMIDSIPALPQTLTYLDCSENTNLRHLPALPGGLKKLLCSYTTLDQGLPPLPASLTYLDCSHDLAPALSSLPPAMDTLICNGNHMATLPALPSSLLYLNCSDNYLLTTLPALPTSLVRLECSYDSLSVLPALPAGLNYLNCSNNHLSVLPALPSGLIHLDCSVNQIPAMPPLPSAATYISCAYNQISSLPSLPAGLISLYCDGNSLSVLPALPATLRDLGFGSNQIRTVPPLPVLLEYLDCSHNPLYTVPLLHDSITTLYCAYDSLSTLPTLPPALSALNASGNQLVHLPSLPSTLTYLGCGDDALLADLPHLPESLENLILTNDSILSCLPPCGFYIDFLLDINGTNVHCLPNYINGYNNSAINQLLPLCTPASGCPFYYNIQGTVHEDTSATCTQDSVSPGSMLHDIKVLLKQNGQVLQQAYTSATGDYSFKTDSLTGYDVALDSSLFPLIPSCPVGGQRSVLLTATDTVAFNQNFGLSCSGNDVGVLAIAASRFRPAFSTTVYPNIGNAARAYGANCGIGIPGTVTTIISGPVSYTGPAAGALTPSAVSGLTLTYTVADLGASDFSSFGIELVTDSAAVQGASVCVATIITPTVPDANPANDTLTQCYTAVNSLDPNLKEVYPKTLTQNADWLTYTIHFQNTGSDTAYTVVVRDTLSNSVQPETFQYLASSHHAVVQLMGKAMVFTFPKINLVDSATNPPLSEGWIQYKVKAKANLPLQTQVKNTAYIYFDLNPAVVTNTTVNIVDTVAAPNGIAHIDDAKPIYLYPNPNAGAFTLQTSAMRGEDYIITDMLGHVVEQRVITSDRQAIYIGNTAAGVYTLSLKGAQPVRFVVVR
jgi:uncharacterized repeat protein (TIGR01451 family)